MQQQSIVLYSSSLPASDSRTPRRALSAFGAPTGSFPAGLPRATAGVQQVAVLVKLLLVVLLVSTTRARLYFVGGGGGGGGVAQLVVVPLAMGRGTKSPGFDSRRGLSFQKGREDGWIGLNPPPGVHGSSPSYASGRLTV